eukprot:gene7421-9122_t
MTAEDDLKKKLKEFTNKIGTGLGKELNESNIITDLIKGSVDIETIARMTSNIAVAGLQFIPVFGTAIAAAVDLATSILFAGLFAPVDPLEPYRKLVRAEIEKYNEADIKAEFQGLVNTLELLSGTVSTAITSNTDANKTSAYNQFLITHNLFISSMPKICKEGFENGTLPIYSQLALYHIFILYDVLTNSKAYNLTAANKTLMQSEFTKYKGVYLPKMKTIYQAGIDRILKETNRKLDDLDEGTLFKQIHDYRNSQIVTVFDKMYLLAFLDTKFDTGLVIDNPRILYNTKFIGNPVRQSYDASNPLGYLSYGFPSVNEISQHIDAADGEMIYGNFEGLDMWVHGDYIRSVQSRYHNSRAGKRIGELNVGTKESLTVDASKPVTEVTCTVYKRNMDEYVGTTSYFYSPQLIQIGTSKVGVDNPSKVIASETFKLSMKDHKVAQIFGLTPRFIGKMNNPIGLDSLMISFVPENSTFTNYVREKATTVISPMKYFVSEGGNLINADDVTVGFNSVQLKGSLNYRFYPNDASVTNFQMYIRVTAGNACTIESKRVNGNIFTYNIPAGTSSTIFDGPSITLVSNDQFTFKVTKGTCRFEAIIFKPK